MLPSALMEETDYCSLSCGKKTHSACESCERGEACRDPDYYEYPARSIARNKIALIHNNIRNYFATGDISGVTISDMRRMHYKIELEYLAMCWLKRCLFEKDPCPRTQLFPNVQQVIFEHDWNWKYGCSFLFIRRFLKSIVQDEPTWVCTGPEGKNCTGDATQVLWSKNKYVGCAMIRYYRVRRTCLLACNYAPGYIGGRLFTTGPPAQKCNETVKEFPGLCLHAKRAGATKCNCHFVVIFYLFIVVCFSKRATIINI